MYKKYKKKIIKKQIEIETRNKTWEGSEENGLLKNQWCQDLSPIYLTR